ncbi:MAG: tail fiber protein [Desulfuromonadales bacterium]
MSDSYLGEIRMFGGNYAPADWALCDGTMLRITDNQPLFALIGTTYGGDGRTTFQLPDLRGRIPVHRGQGTNLTNRVLGQTLGTETVTLTELDIMVHSHTISVGDASTTGDPSPVGGVKNYLANSSGYNLYSTATSGDTSMASAEIGAAPGGGQPHDNVMQSFSINYIICLQGLFPTPA